MKAPDPSSLESHVESAVKYLHDRRAPRSLETRVLAEIQRRAALPWWRKSYADWPTPVRAGFFLGSAVAAALAVLSFSRLALPASVAETLQTRTSSLAALGSAGDALVRLASHFLQSVPSLWLYGSVAAFAGCYLCLVGLGAAAYKTLRSSL